MASSRATRRLGNENADIWRVYGIAASVVLGTILGLWIYGGGQ